MSSNPGFDGDVNTLRKLIIRLEQSDI